MLAAAGLSRGRAVAGFSVPQLEQKRSSSSSSAWQTAHFVTSDLDEGPIIEQNVVRVEHSRSVAELVAIGQDEESRTLSQAVKWFAERRVLLDGQRTVIFR